MTDYQKGQRKIKAIVKKATQERDTKGYRENLGYDQQNTLEYYLNTLKITWRDRVSLVQEFFRACDAI